MRIGFEGKLVRKLAGFLSDIGLSVVPGRFEEETFLPGILVKDGGLIVDEARLLHPGDLLHEAGHLAVLPPEVRKTLNGDLMESGADTALIEVAAIAWSYAACVHLSLDPKVVFHSAGYRGRSAALLLGFRVGVYPGANQLDAAGLTAVGASALDRGVQPYPHMIRWVRE